MGKDPGWLDGLLVVFYDASMMRFNSPLSVVQCIKWSHLHCF